MTDNQLMALVAVFTPLSLLSFGGGQAIIPDMQHQAVAVHGWMSNAEFADLFAISRAAPGPSTLIVALIGWQVDGFLGALISTLTIFIPSSIVVYLASAWWLRNKGSIVRNAIERALAPVAVGLIFAGAAIVLTAARGGVLTWVTTAAVCILLSTTKTSSYRMVGIVAACYSVLYGVFPALAG